MIRHSCGSTIPPDVGAYVRHLASCPKTHEEIGSWCRAIVTAVDYELAHGETAETPAVPRDSSLSELIADLSDTGPGTPVDPRAPGYALALLVDAAAQGDVPTSREYFLGLGERVFSALSDTTEASTETRDLSPAEMADMWRDGKPGGVSLRDIAAIAHGIAPETVRRRINKWKQENGL